MNENGDLSCALGPSSCSLKKARSEARISKERKRKRRNEEAKVKESVEIEAGEKILKEEHKEVQETLLERQKRNRECQEEIQKDV